MEKINGNEKNYKVRKEWYTFRLIIVILIVCLGSMNIMFFRRRRKITMFDLVVICMAILVFSYIWDVDKGMEMI